MRIAIVAIVTSLFLSACGGGDDTGTNQTSATSTPALATATPRPAVQVTSTSSGVTATTTQPTAPAGTPQTGVEIILVAAYGAPPGGDAYVEARVTPGATCDLDYRTPSGTNSEAEGLDTKTADANGDLRWDWRISPSTEPGRGEVTVTCGDAEQTVGITIG